MTTYRYDRNIKLFRRTKTKAIRYLVLITAIVAGAWLYILLKPNYNPAPVDGNVINVKNDPFQEFETEFFKFKVSKNWSEVKELSGGRQYVYRKYISSTPVGSLSITIDAESLPLVTEILPVTVSDGEIKQVGEVSNHCSDYLTGDYNLDPHDVTIDGVNFKCWTDGAEYIVAVGQRNGGLGLNLRRSNQEERGYLIVYQNTSFEPDREAIMEVVRYFEAR